MTDTPAQQPPGWYYAQGDPPGTQRYWDGTQWQGGPQAVPAAGAAGGYGAMAGPELASPWARLGARIVDFFVLIIPLLIVSAVIGGGIYGLGGGEASFAASAIGGIIGSIIAIGYEYYFLSKDGATIGKKALNIKVVRTDGSELGQDGSIKRLILSALGAIPIIGGLIGLVVGIATAVMIFTDSKRQVPADKIADSMVIKT